MKNSPIGMTQGNPNINSTLLLMLCPIRSTSLLGLERHSDVIPFEGRCRDRRRKVAPTSRNLESKCQTILIKVCGCCCVCLSEFVSAFAIDSGLTNVRITLHSSHVIWFDPQHSFAESERMLCGRFGSESVQGRLLK